MENGFWARAERDELRRAGRALGARVELRYLDAPVSELWRRLSLRNREAAPGTVPISRADLEKWSATFEPPHAAELGLFDSG